jgi:hypothetical protein
LIWSFDICHAHGVSGYMVANPNFILIVPLLERQG